MTVISIESAAVRLKRLKMLREALDEARSQLSKAEENMDLARRGIERLDAEYRELLGWRAQFKLSIQ